MKSKKFGLLLLSLALSSGTNLVNRFLVEVPNWLADISIVLSAVCLVAFILLSLPSRKTN